MEFEWDDEKANRNARKHGITFKQAKAVFVDPNLLIDIDETTDDEERWNAIGMSSDHVLFVVYVERQADALRLISARRATRDEQDRYYRQALSEG